MSSTAMNASDSVFGHYVQQGNSWEPLLSESSPLFQAIVNDDARTLEAELGSDSGKASQFYVLLYWGSRPTSASPDQHDQSEDGMKPAVTVKQRTLLMIAAFHGSMRILALLAVNGADPATVSPDGLTAYQLAYSSQRQEAATVVAYLRDAEQSLQVLRGQLDASGKTGVPQLTLEALPAGGVDLSNPQMRGMWNIPQPGRMEGGESFNQDALSYSTAELTKPEYSTDEFRMYCFKILQCCRRYAHDWRACPFAHPTENARRRDPREFQYCSLPCPDYKQGFCIRGDACAYAHGVFECWLHPSKFRTQLCKDGNKCRRPVCFFAHSLMELRSPTHTWTPSPDALKKPPPPPPPVVMKEQEKVEDPIRQSSEDSNFNTELNTVCQKSSEEAVNGGELPPQVPVLNTKDSNQDSGPQEGHSMGDSTSEILSKKVQAAKTAGITPRMSNAFARKHGLNLKDGPSINFQRLSNQGCGGGGNQVSRPVSAFDRRSQSFDSRTVSLTRSSSSRQRRSKQANHSALDSLNFSMNSLSFSGRSGSRNSITESSSFPLNPGPPLQNPVVESNPQQFNNRGGLHHSHSTGEHLRSHSAILPDLTGSLDSSFQFLNDPSLGSASSFLGLQNYVLGHSASYTPGGGGGNSFTIPDGGGGSLQQNHYHHHHAGPFESVRSADFRHLQQHPAAIHALSTAAGTTCPPWGQNLENSGST